MGRPKGKKSYTTNEVAGGIRDKKYTSNRPPKKSKKDLKEKLLKELHNCYGVIKYACAQSGVSREFFYKAMKDDEEFKKNVDDVYDERIDDLEKTAFDLAVKNGDNKMIIFLLNNLAKKRGYNQAQEFKLDIIKPIEIIYINPDDIKTNE